jgi:hypothetical protein
MRMVRASLCDLLRLRPRAEDFENPDALAVKVEISAL